MTCSPAACLHSVDIVQKVSAVCCQRQGLGLRTGCQAGPVIDIAIEANALREGAFTVDVIVAIADVRETGIASVLTAADLAVLIFNLSLTVFF